MQLQPHERQMCGVGSRLFTACNTSNRSVTRYSNTRLIRAFGICLHGRPRRYTRIKFRTHIVSNSITHLPPHTHTNGKESRFRSV
eukprot:5720645-Prymnesium_polylepis.1